MSEAARASSSALLSSSPASTTTSPIGETTTSLLAFATPYSYPSECTGVWAFTSAATYGNFPTTVAIALSDREDPRFAPCQPSGWADVVPESRFSFSPAVCPSGWTAYSIATQPLFANNRFIATGSTAYCCAGGFNLYSPTTTFAIPSLTHPCTRTIGNGQAAADQTVTGRVDHGSGVEAALIKGLLVHEAWHITWQESDLATLSPTPPSLTGQTIPTWIPGAADTTPLNHSVSGGTFQFPLIWTVLLSCLGASLVTGLCVYIYRRRRVKKDEKPAPGLNPQNASSEKQEIARYA
ncbi:hypothetical protein GQ53DRAFT_842151 [Thozetella sp. PMI_491]|nr:hypothetical protein GQ53DRAFT_842151 [Thozetella sp. PMI_491]